MQPQRIAILGTGIAGLSAAWYLGANHHITLFERYHTLGMAAHGLELGGTRVDMPLRVIYRRYYPTLSALYEQAGITTQAVSYSGSFSHPGQSAYFRYANWRAFNQSWPRPAAGLASVRARSRYIIADLLRFFATAKRRPPAYEQSLRSWLKQHRYSEAFHRYFILPTFAGIATCTYEQVDDYPARVIVDYLAGGVMPEGVRRTTQGADHVVGQLASRCAEQRLGCAIASIVTDADGVSIVDEQGHKSRYDHVLVATQANQAASILAQAEPETAALLAQFQYQSSQVVVHKDPRLAPAYRRDWSPVNFIVDPAQTMPMATIWLNAVLAMAPDEPAVFQSWNPHVQPQQELCRAEFQRPVVDAGTASRLNQLRALHQQPNRRIWLAGSYAAAGVPLLESAAASAKTIALRFGC